jgi:TonB family protein
VLVLLIHLPVSITQPRVGWLPDGGAERIALSQVRLPAESDDQDGPEEGTASAPPPTQYLLPAEADAPTGTADGSGGEEAAAGSVDSSGTSSEVRHVSSLTMSDRHPEILGGRGILSLHLKYPAAAREQGIEGRMEVQFTVDTDGEARNIVVSKPLHPLCDSAAVDAIRAVRFRPGTYEGEPIPVRMSLPIRFEIRPTEDPGLPGQTAQSSNG